MFHTAVGGSVMILENYGDSMPETPDLLSSSYVFGVILKDVKVKTTSDFKTGQRRAAASEMESTA